MGCCDMWYLLISFFTVVIEWLFGNKSHRRAHIRFSVLLWWVAPKYPSGLPSCYDANHRINAVVVQQRLELWVNYLHRSLRMLTSILWAQQNINIDLMGYIVWSHMLGHLAWHFLKKSFCRNLRKSRGLLAMWFWICTMIYVGAT